MSPDAIGLMIGIAFIVPTIALIRRRRWDRLAWPAFLATLPVYYMLFGVLALDPKVIVRELLYGLPYFLTAAFVWRLRSRRALIVCALAWLSHGLYDFYHDLLFINPGVFSWYPAFCALVDIGVAGYLFLSVARLTDEQPGGEPRSAHSSTG